MGAAALGRFRPLIQLCTSEAEARSEKRRPSSQLPFPASSFSSSPLWPRPELVEVQKGITVLPEKSLFFTKFPQLALGTFTFITAGKSGKSFTNVLALEKAVKESGRSCAFAEWSARLPLSEQNKLANALFAKGAPVNIINFTPKSVLPPDGMGSEHMYSFDCAYRLKSVQEWLFRQSR